MTYNIHVQDYGLQYNPLFMLENYLQYEIKTENETEKDNQTWVDWDEHEE